MKLMRRPATESDKAFVRAVGELAFEDVVARQFGAWDEKLQEHNFNHKWERASFEVIGRSGEPIGAIWTTINEDHVRLHDVFLLPKSQGQGVGQQLLRQELAKARRLGKPLRLRVLRENRARALYERLGFAICGATETQFWMEAV